MLIRLTKILDSESTQQIQSNHFITSGPIILSKYIKWLICSDLPTSFIFKQNVQTDTYTTTFSKFIWLSMTHHALRRDVIATHNSGLPVTVKYGSTQAGLWQVILSTSRSVFTQVSVQTEFTPPLCTWDPHRLSLTPVQSIRLHHCITVWTEEENNYWLYFTTNDMDRLNDKSSIWSQSWNSSNGHFEPLPPVLIWLTILFYTVLTCTGQIQGDWVSRYVTETIDKTVSISPPVRWMRWQTSWGDRGGEGAWVALGRREGDKRKVGKRAGGSASERIKREKACHPNLFESSWSLYLTEGSGRQSLTKLRWTVQRLTASTPLSCPALLLLLPWGPGWSYSSSCCYPWAQPGVLSSLGWVAQAQHLHTLTWVGTVENRYSRCHLITKVFLFHVNIENDLNVILYH